MMVCVLPQLKHWKWAGLPAASPSLLKCSLALFLNARFGNYLRSRRQGNGADSVNLMTLNSDAIDSYHLDNFPVGLKISKIASNKPLKTWNKKQDRKFSSWPKSVHQKQHNQIKWYNTLIGNGWTGPFVTVVSSLLLVVLEKEPDSPIWIRVDLYLGTE